MMDELQKIWLEVKSLGAEAVNLSNTSVYWKSNYSESNDYIHLSEKPIMVKDNGISVYDNGIVELVQDSDLVHNLELQQMGIDLMDLKPHDYGILKLKYNLAPLDLYVPECIKQKYGGGNSGT